MVVNPLVTELKAGKSSLISIQYNSAFRDLTRQTMENLFKPKVLGNEKPGIGPRNKLIEERIRKQKEEANREVAPDPKAKGGKVAAAPAKKEEKKAEPKASKKTPQ